MASSTNKRSLIATLLPPHTTSMNSLLSQKNANKFGASNKLFILGILNSYVLDFVLRQLISININQIYLQQLPIPKESDVRDAPSIIQITKELLKKILITIKI